jgi:hypothetical protein
MKDASSTSPRPKPAARHRTHRAPGAPAPTADEAADESGNRALHAVATGPNPNVGRNDVERASPGRPGRGGVEST